MTGPEDLYIYIYIYTQLHRHTQFVHTIRPLCQGYQCHFAKLKAGLEALVQQVLGLLQRVDAGLGKAWPA